MFPHLATSKFELKEITQINTKFLLEKKKNLGFELFPITRVFFLLQRLRL